MATTLLATSTELDDTQRFIRLARFLRWRYNLLYIKVSVSVVGTDFMVDDFFVCPNLGNDLHRSAPSETVD